MLGMDEIGLMVRIPAGTNPPDRLWVTTWPPFKWTPEALSVGVQRHGRAGDRLHEVRTLIMCTAKFQLLHNSLMTCFLLEHSD